MLDQGILQVNKSRMKYFMIIQIPKELPCIECLQTIAKQDPGRTGKQEQ